MAAKPDVQALLFDVFGTVVDWRSSIIADMTKFGADKGIKADWAAFTDEWRGLYQPAMEEVRSGRRAWTILDVLHRESLDKLLEKHAITGLSEADKDHINRVWHRLNPGRIRWRACAASRRATSSARSRTATSAC